MSMLKRMQAFRVVVHNIFLLTASAWDLISTFPQILQTAKCCHNSAGVQWHIFNSSGTCAQYNAAFGTTAMSQQGLLVPFADFLRRSSQCCSSTSPTATSASIPTIENPLRRERWNHHKDNKLHVKQYFGYPEWRHFLFD